jgi:uncharacterized protein YbjQ (UPF0145 family)
MIDIYILIALIVTGYVVGQYLEKKHYRSIKKREKDFIDLATTVNKSVLGELPGEVRTELVQGACVISVDYFKRFVARLRQLFGGNIRSYETLVDRARREAILRLKESAADASQVVNLRIETSSITKGRRNQIGSVEVHAYATAIYY